MGKNNGKIRVKTFSSTSTPDACLQKTGFDPIVSAYCIFNRMKKPMRNAIEKIISLSFSPIWQFCFVLAILYFILTGCASDNGVAKSIDNIRLLPEERKESFRYPLRSSVTAASEVLAASGFSIVRIELQRENGAVEAVREKTKIDCRFHFLTEDFTRVRLTVRNSDLVADPAAKPDRILGEIGTALQGGSFSGLHRLTENMTPVHIEPDGKSPAADFLWPDAEVTLYTDYKDPSWSRVKLATGNYGYIKNRNVKSIPFKP